MELQLGPRSEGKREEVCTPPLPSDNSLLFTNRQEGNRSNFMMDTFNT